MYRLIDLPVYSATPTAITAEQFNLIRRAVINSSQPIRIPLNNLTHVDIIIDKDSWVCVDNSNNDSPIVAWVNFESQHRDAIHTPIGCTKNYYHFAAGKVSATALQTATNYLTENFATAPVCQLPVARKHKKVWQTRTDSQLFCI